MAACKQCERVPRDGMNIKIIVFRDEFQLIVRLSDCSSTVGSLLTALSNNLSRTKQKKKKKKKKKADKHNDDDKQWYFNLKWQTC